MKKTLPARIEDYRILEELGEGGMGIVYLAQQEQPLRRRVALKVIKLGMDTREVIARFESERQALALMSHAGIAKVLDAGETEQGRPYFVMEHVAGIPINQYCDKQRLRIRERLELFVLACQAIHHAHQKGIIHRDIKPGNVLVSQEDGRSVPKVIDFGVAKATNQRLTEKTLFTQKGSVIGTPEYMSPEQAETGGVGVDTTTDIYSLGVLLYEMLAGALPFELRGLSYAQMERTICEEDPPKLTVRLNSLGDTGERIAERRHTDLRSLAKRLGGELEWITRKAMEKDRARRYASASELAADVERHLRNEPVIAGPPSAAYQLRKLITRHKAPIAVAATLAVLLVGFAVAMAVQANRIAREAARANREAEVALQVSAFMEELFQVSDPSEALGDTITAREILDRGADRIEQELSDQPVVQARLMLTIGRVYRSLGLYEPSGPLLEQALRMRERELGTEHPDVAESLHELALLYWDQGEYHAKAESLSRRTIAIREQALGPDHSSTASSLSLLAALYVRQGQYAEAEPLYQRALAIREQALGPDHHQVAESLHNLAGLHRRQGEYAEAKPLYQRALAIHETVLGPEHPRVASTLGALASLYRYQGKYAEAEPLYQRSLAIQETVLGPEHPDVAISLTNFANLYVEQGRYAEAETLFRRATRIREDKLGPEHPYLAWSLHGLANVYRNQNRFGEAEPLYERALAIRENVLGADHPEVGWTLNDMAGLYARQGNTAEAERVYQRALAIREEALGPDHPDVAKTLEDYAVLLRSLGRDDEADELEARAQVIKSGQGQ
jgi:tetratricopeptide (TPR) repeat protein